MIDLNQDGVEEIIVIFELNKESDFLYQADVFIVEEDKLNYHNELSQVETMVLNIE